MNSTTAGGKDSALSCKNATWTDVLLFFGANYVSHAATLKTIPGESTLETGFGIILTLLLPASGIYKASLALWRLAIKNGGSELRGAARAGALCMVIRSKKWRPRAGDRIEGLHVDHADMDDKSDQHGPGLVMNMEILTPMGAVDSHIDTHKRPIHADTKNGSTSLHGSHDLPEGYRFAFVPPNAVFEIPEPIPGHTQVEHISSSRSVPKSLIAIFQAIYATITLYQTRGDQLERFGYAAFGLTVTPYLIMSVVNFAAQIATPDYQSLFLITSEVSDEAERRGGSFTGAVGRLHPAPDGGLSAGRGDIGVFENELPLSSSESPVRCRIMRRSQDSEWQIQALELSDEDFEPSRSCLYVPSCTATRSWTWTDSLRGWAGADDERLGGNKDGFSDPHALGVSAITSLLSIFVFDFVILLVIGLSTRFQARDSTYAQRAWILSWLVTGSLQGFFMVALPFAFRYEKKTGVLYWYITTVLTVVVLAYCTPAVGGLVTVAQELYQYGICN